MFPRSRRRQESGRKPFRPHHIVREQLISFDHGFEAEKLQKLNGSQRRHDEHLNLIILQRDPAVFGLLWVLQDVLNDFGQHRHRRSRLVLSVSVKERLQCPLRGINRFGAPRPVRFQFLQSLHVLLVVLFVASKHKKKRTESQ